MLYNFIVTGLASLQSQSGIHTFFNNFVSEVEKNNGFPTPSCYSSCLDSDTYRELLSRVKSISDIYSTGSPVECSSDEED